MPHDPQLRASDSDRDRTAAQLREHHALGRITVAEFRDRLDLVYEARTLGDLDQIMADLPPVDIYELPEAAMRREWLSGDQRRRSRGD